MFEFGQDFVCFNVEFGWLVVYVGFDVIIVVGDEVENIVEGVWVEGVCVIVFIVEGVFGLLGWILYDVVLFKVFRGLVLE